MRSTLEKGVAFGMTMVAGMPSRPAQKATPWAWLPADMAMTPACCCAGVRLRILTKAPRGLNEPVCCWVSSFSQTSQPSAAESAGAGTVGVRTMWP